MTTPLLEKRLRKSRDKKIAGVCGGVADYFGIDPTLVRVAWALLTILTVGFPGLLIYVILALVMPDPL